MEIRTSRYQQVVSSGYFSEAMPYEFYFEDFKLG
jgi:hypothetical protein